VVNTDGTNAHRLLQTPRLSEFHLDWSPTGKRIAFTDVYGMSLHLRVMNTNAKNVRTIVTGRGIEFATPDWSPDGRSIAFMSWPVRESPPGTLSGSLSEAEIWVTNVSGRSWRLTHNSVLDTNPVWSPDGSKFAFVHGGAPNWSFLSPAKRDSSDIYVMNADGSGMTRLTHNDVGEAFPAWQPVVGR
jgi:TolB protein